MAKSVPEQIIDQIFALLPAEITKAVGRRETETNAKPHRVVAVPLGGPIEEPDRPGDKKYTDAGRILFVRYFQIDWYCHGVRDGSDALDFARAEDVYLTVIEAVRQVCHHAVRFSDERWEEQEEGRDSFMRFGSVIRFTSTIQIPIYERRGGLRLLTADPPIVTTATLNGEEP